MNTKYFSLMTCLVVALSGCLAGRVLKKTTGFYAHVAGKTVGRVLPSLPQGGGGGDPGDGQVADASHLLDGCIACAEPPHPLVVQREEQVEDDSNSEPAPRTHHDRDPGQISYTRQVTQAPSYPSSPYIAMYPSSKGSNDHVCKAFQQSADNKNDCMVECRHQLTFGPGSCSCMEMDRCPDGVRVIR